MIHEDVYEYRGFYPSSHLQRLLIKISKNQQFLSQRTDQPSKPTMSSQDKTQTVFSRGIYHGLPTFPDPTGNGLTAIITGANGISGYYMLRVLSQSPQRWSKIYCLSRRPPLIPGGLPSNAEHIALDFLKSPEEIAGVLKEKGVSKADYVFFFSYIQVPPKEGGGLWSDAEEVRLLSSHVFPAMLCQFLSHPTSSALTSSMYRQFIPPPAPTETPRWPE